MSIETEIKVRVGDDAEFQRRLKALRPSMLSPRHFEDNYVLDYPDGNLKSRGCLIRLRAGAGVSLLTFKDAPQPGAVFKIREELETTVGDATVMAQVLQRLGLLICFRYQKFRCEYLVDVPALPGQKIHVVVDETPVGEFAEFEGTEAGIRSVAQAMGFDEAEYIRDSYYALYIKFCLERGEEPGDMLFPGEEQGQGPNL